MSTLPIEISRRRSEGRSTPVTVTELQQMKETGAPIVMVTGYDHPSACVLQDAGVDMILVGDSAAMVVLGHDSTVPVTVDEMVMLAAAVRRGARIPFVVGDMPFGSYEASDELAVANAQRFVKEARCDAVKLEGGGTSARRAAAIAASGIPVMGHVGLTPQTATALGGFKAQGKTAGGAAAILEDALALQAAGCFSIVIECVPAAVTELICDRLSVPTIGIGAGPSTSGQVIVYHDLLGLRAGTDPKFVRRYADLRDAATSAVGAFAADVRTGTYPGPEHAYAIEPSELSDLRQALDRVAAGS